MPTYKLVVEYQGTRYSGWQEQRNARTVAGELRAAAGRVAGEAPDVGGAGRTDAGVHAVGQVAHLRFRSPIDPEPFRRALNDELPLDVHVAALAPAADNFHARHDAKLRSYVYQISRRRTPFARRFVWWVKRPLDPAAMAAAAALCQGKRDFAGFCERPADQTSTIVVLDQALVVEEGGLILVRLAASHFLWKMARRMVGALVKVGAGEWRPEAMAALLDGTASPSLAAAVAEGTAPPSGLFLERVLYAGDAPLAPPSAPFPVAAEPFLAAATPVRRPREGTKPAGGAGRVEAKGPAPRHFAGAKRGPDGRPKPRPPRG
ncbi:MAG: tRNA pseudouridine(38-40) synthase TruA [Candidatus Polarisedimenticolia bacterium]|nr:tRNA pseudouridine(38-40) synthase TruA [bacterium]